MTPREYVGNEFHNVPVVHPNHEMDARPAFITWGYKKAYPDARPLVAYPFFNHTLDYMENITGNPWPDAGATLISSYLAGCGSD